MARYLFAGTTDDMVIVRTPGGLMKTIAATLTFWDAPTGGTQHTDLLLDGTPVTDLTIGADGLVPAFEGPDGVDEMWVQVTASVDQPAARSLLRARGAGADPAGTAQTLIDQLKAGAPGTLDNLDELAQALGDDPAFATTILGALAGKQDQAALPGDVADLDADPTSQLRQQADARLSATYVRLPKPGDFAEGDSLILIVDPTQSTGFRWGLPPITPTARIDAFDAARSGITAGGLVASSGGLSETDYAKLLTSYEWTAPSLAVVCLGANDYLNAGSSPAQVASLLERLVDDLRALPTAPSVLLAIPHDLTSDEGTVGRTWADYKAALEGVAASRATGLWQMSDTIPSQGTSSSLLRTDGLHPSDSGHAALADDFTGVLTDILTTRPAWASAWLDAQTSTSAAILGIGDSLIEGQGASTKANRWFDLALSGYRTNHALSASPTYYQPSHFAVYAPDSPWHTPYTVPLGTAGKQPWAPALGKRYVQVYANSGVTWSGLSGTHADVWLFPGSGVTITYQVDGGAAQSITGLTEGALQRVAVPLGVAGNHSLRINNTSGANAAYVAGFTVSTS